MNEQRIPVNQENSELNIPIHSEGISANVELTRETSVIRGVDGISPVAYVEQTSTGATITVTDAEGTTTANILNGERGEQGPRGLQGERGETGATGADGSAATVSVGTTTTGQPGTNASVTNSGTSSAAVLNFTIPRGERGETGAAGTNGTNGQDGYSPTATVVKNDHIAVITITDKNGTTTASVSDGSDATVTVDSALSSTSTNPVQNSIITAAIGDVESILTTLNNGGGAQ